MSRKRRWVASAGLFLVAVGLGGCATGPPVGGGHTASPEVMARALDRSCATPAPASSRFELRSSLWLNLHNFLFREARRSNGMEDDGLLAAGNLALPLTPARPLTPAEDEAWAAAVRAYRDVIFDGAVHADSVVIRVNNALATTQDAELRDVRIPSPMRDALLAVAPLYRAAWWPDHDGRNRAWIAEAGARLAEWEDCLAPRLAETFGGEWPAGPIPVDVTVYASWAAAYTTFDPPHITVSSTAVGSQGLFALELLMHEAGHTLMRPVEEALRRAAAERGARADARLAHLLLFYTAGDLVWRAVPGYPTAAEAFGIWRQNDRAAAYRELLVREWRPYLTGERSLDEAIARLAAAAAPAP